MTAFTNPNPETKICKVCGRELTIDKFRRNRGGIRINTCTECVTAAYHANRAAKRAALEAPYDDPEFHGKTTGDVVCMMGRAKKWLEARGYTIVLRGELKQIVVKQVKFS